MPKLSLRVAAPEPRVRPAKVISLDARREARLDERVPRPPYRPVA